MTTPVPPLTDIPAFPALADRAAGTYNSKAFAFGTHMADVFNSEMLALANNVLDNADAAAASAASASDDAAAAALSAGSASDSAAAAVSAANSAVAAFDNFDDRYLGAKASDPTTDNDGNALIVGALYFNSGGGGGMRAWNGAAWEAAYLPASGYQTTLVSGTNIKTINGASVLGSGNLVTTYRVAQYTSSATFTVPAGCTKIRPYAFGAGAAGTATNCGGGGGCAYGDIAVTPGDNVTLTISAGVAQVTLSGVGLLTAYPASGTTAGTAIKHASVTNGGAYSGGAGVANGGGASSGSPLGVGVSGVASVGGSGWGGAGTAGGGGGVGGPASTKRGGDGLSVPSTEPLFDGLTARGGSASGLAGGSGGHGGGGGSSDDGGAGGFGGGGGRGSGGSGSNFGGDGGFGGGGGWANSGAGGAGGFGGGGGRGSGGGGPAGAAVIRIYY